LVTACGARADGSALTGTEVTGGGDIQWMPPKDMPMAATNVLAAATAP
jgi:hypothetical protein